LCGLDFLQEREKKGVLGAQEVNKKRGEEGSRPGLLPCSGKTSPPRNRKGKGKAIVCPVFVKVERGRALGGKRGRGGGGGEDSIILAFHLYEKERESHSAARGKERGGRMSLNL